MPVSETLAITKSSSRDENQVLCLTSEARTHCGLVRNENQDAFGSFSCAFGEVFVIADGMGGHKGGSRAATMVVDEFTHLLKTLPSAMSLDEALKHTASQANTEIYREGTAGVDVSKGMGSTVVLAIVRKDQLCIAHVGDSRAYLFRKGQLTRLTADHNAVQRLVASNVLSDTDARNHPDANRLTRSLGQETVVNIEISGYKQLRDGDIVLLCSDGLSGHVSHRFIRRLIARTRTLQDVADGLVQLALNAGGKDNVTVYVIQFGTYRNSTVMSLWLRIQELFSKPTRRWIEIIALGLCLLMITALGWKLISVRTEKKTVSQTLTIPIPVHPVPTSGQPKPQATEPSPAALHSNASVPSHAGKKLVQQSPHTSTPAPISLAPPTVHPSETGARTGLGSALENSSAHNGHVWPDKRARVILLQGKKTPSALVDWSRRVVGDEGITWDGDQRGLPPVRTESVLILSNLSGVGLRNALREDLKWYVEDDGRKAPESVESLMSAEQQILLHNGTDVLILINVTKIRK